MIVSEPVKFIIDAKTTRRDSVASINFTRIRRHMRQHSAEFMVIASVGFDRAVCRDAQTEGATLVEVETLRRLLKLHRKYVLSPFDYLSVLKRPGLLTEDDLAPLLNKAKGRVHMMNRLRLLLDSLDFKPRTLDEIRGRMEVYCEKQQIPIMEKDEIRGLLDLLSREFFGVVSRQDDTCSLVFTTQASWQRIKSTIGCYVRRKSPKQAESLVYGPRGGTSQRLEVGLGNSNRGL